MADKKIDDVNSVDTAKAAGKAAMILQIVFVAVNISVTGFGAYMVYASTIGWTNPKITQQALESDLSEIALNEPLIYTMDKLTVNLGGEPRRTIRIEINLEMIGKEGFEEVINTENRAKARDRIVRLLNEKSLAELESIQGKLFLKDKIASEINSIVSKGVVKDVFFTDFVVQ
ncbi:MAG: flagellar basal body-associated protein FliL [Pseudobdellovibrionaceae bacterium]